MRETIDRRAVLKKGLVLGGVGTAAGLLATASGAGCARAQESSKLTLDVACLGDTLRITPAPGNEDGDLRGNTFYVEGWVYPEDTIEGDGFEPTKDGVIGLWLCRGWFMIAPDRAEPHVITTQEYVIGDIRKNRLFPPDVLVSSGTEGSDAEEQTPVRSIIGGTGKYAGANGVVLQNPNGKNTTTLKGVGDKAPTFRFAFTYVMPELDLNGGSA